MTTKHTPEPWKILYDGQIEADGIYICSFRWSTYKEFTEDPESAANARRIVACVNALAGLNPQAIPDIIKLFSFSLGIFEEFEEMLADVGWVKSEGAIAETIKQMKAALAKAKGEA